MNRHMVQPLVGCCDDLLEAVPFSDSQLEVLRRFWSKVELQANGCMLWTGSVNDRDSRYKYGRFTYAGRAVYAHRLSLHLFGEGMTEAEPYALHTCDTSLCVNPKHLRRGTLSDNQLQRWRRIGRTRKYDDTPRALGAVA